MSQKTTADMESQVIATLASESTIESTSNSSETNNGTKRFKVYEIPHEAYNQLCRELDEVQKQDPEFWKTLAEKMGLKAKKIEDIKCRYEQKKFASIAEELIGIYADKDKSVNQLFVMLEKLKQFTAMEIIKNWVHEKHHKLLVPIIPNMAVLLSTSIQRLSVTSPANLPMPLGLSSTPKITTKTSPDVATTPSSPSSEIAVPEVNYDELTEATGNWNGKNILGSGGYGKVYHGFWIGTHVAVKRIEPRDQNVRDYKLEFKQSLNELRFLNSCRHDNVLPLYGYSRSGAHPCLIYQLMPGGTLEQRLYEKNSLTWIQKYCIALGTARGLQFLHNFRGEKPLIHGDIKPANILLDNSLTPKIGDFGLTRESPSREPVEISRVYGTRPYLPPEFIATKCLSTKVDTYSFGIVLYEMATKKKVLDYNRTSVHLIDLMKNYHDESKGISYTDVIDTTHRNDQLGLYIFSIFTTLGQECTSDESSKRPEMKEVCQRIESCLLPQQQQPLPDLKPDLVKG